MIPVLYDAAEWSFDHNGIGHLTDCILCEVTEERNGGFELLLQYHITGRWASEIRSRAIIKATADDVREPQLFRIYSISKPLGGIITVKAAHISYDLNGMPVAPFAADNAGDAMRGLWQNAATIGSDFGFDTDMPTQAGHFETTVPVSARAALGGIEGNILSVYGGEIEWNNRVVSLRRERGRDRGVTVRYGHNLTDFVQDENCANVYTGVYPYWQRTETVDNQSVRRYVELPERVVAAPGTYNYQRILPLDLSAEFEDAPTEAQLREAAETYIDAAQIGIPEVNITVSFVPLHQTAECREVAVLETVALCDTVGVIFPQLGVTAKSNVVKVVWDTLRDCHKAVTLGTIKSSVADLIVAQGAAIGATQDGVKAIDRGNLNATDFNLYGSFTVRNGGAVGGRLGYMSGMRGDGSITNGIGMSNADGSCFALVTDAGVCLRAGDVTFVVTPSGVVANGNQIG